MIAKIKNGKVIISLSDNDVHIVEDAVEYGEPITLTSKETIASPKPIEVEFRRG